MTSTSEASASAPVVRLTGKQMEALRFLGGPGRHKLIYGGARSGKTFTCIRAIGTRASRFPGSRHAILRLRANAVRSSITLDTLPKVFSLCFPEVKIKEHRQDGFFELPNKSQLWMGGLDDKDRVEKILGQEFATIYLNECSQIPYSSVMIARTRLAQNIDGLKQRMYYDMNPTGKGHWSYNEFIEKKDPISRELLSNPDDFGWLKISPMDNAENLTPEFIASLANLPERQRRRFYDGDYTTEVENALWTYESIDAIRVSKDDTPLMEKIVVAVDPSGARGAEDVRSDEIGIVVIGRGADGRAYVLEDCSCRLGPSGWAKVVVSKFYEYQADCIIAEVNFGKALVESTIRTEDPDVPIREVRAARGKHIRAEPVANLYDPKVDAVRHVGRFNEVEDQLCSFTTGGYVGDRSPDRADALIWGLTHLLVRAQAPQAFFTTYGMTR